MAMMVLAGRRFGMLTVMMDWPLGPKGYRLCRCDCGNGDLVEAGALNRGSTVSCGCYRRSGDNQKTHGMAYTAEHRIWRGINARVRKAPPGGERYPERGVCDRWNCAAGGSFENFYADMGPRPTPKHTVERYDNDGPYAPWNCGWELMRVQARNRSNNRLCVYKGERMLLKDAAALAGVKYVTVRARIRKGWPEANWFIPTQTKPAAGSVPMPV